MLERAIKSYDIRGIFEQDLHISDFASIAQKLCTYVAQFHNKIVLVIGHDARPHAQACYHAAVQGAQALGVHVVQLGLVTTPMVLTALYKKIGTCGLMITASHNPEQYAGAKLYIQDQSIAGKDLVQLMQTAVPAQQHVPGSMSETKIDSISLFLAQKNSHIQGMSVACDVTNSALQPYINRLAHMYGLQLTTVHDEKRGYDPTHPQALQQVMRSGSYQLGLAFDGDADRVVVVLPGGRVLGGDEMTALFAWYTFQKKGECVVVLDQKISPLLQNWLEQQGVQAHVSQTGCMHIKKTMKEVHAHVGGEMSGHYFFTGQHPGFDDAWHAALQAAGMVAEYGSRYLSALLPTLHESKELRIQGNKEDLQMLASFIMPIFNLAAGSLDLDSGIRCMHDGAWIMMRFSQTEPVLCVRFGAQKETVYVDIAKKVEVLIQNHTGQRCE